MCINIYLFFEYLEFCGGIIRGKDGIISSPNYPAMYPKDQECVWWLIGPDDHSLTIQFRDIHLPGLRRCENTDHVFIGEKVPHNETGKHNSHFKFLMTKYDSN